MKRNDDPPDEDHGEAMEEEIYNTLILVDPKSLLSEEWMGKATDAMMQIVGRAYMEGYRQGQTDEAMAREFQKTA